MSRNSHTATREISLRKQPIQSRSTVTFDAILEAAIQVLERLGYGRLTTARVAEVAGVSVGSLYQYFPNKQALVREIVRRHIEKIASRLSLAAGAAAGPEEATRGIVHAFVAVKRETLPLSRALVLPLRELNKKDLVEASVRRVVELMVPLIQKVHPTLGEARQQMMAGLLVTTIENLVMNAIENSPAVLEDPQFAEELAVLAVSYLKRAG